MSAIIDSLIERYPALSGARQSIETLCQWLMETYANGNRLLVAGNGGSCADAEHIAGELLKSFKYHRPIDPVDQNILIHRIYRSMIDPVDPVDPPDLS